MVFDAAGKPYLWSRNGLPLEQKFPAISKAVSRLKLRSSVLDGEIVAVDENGIPRFQLLQRFQKQPPARRCISVFDMLWTNEADVTGKTLMEPRAVLESIVKPVSGIPAWEFCRGSRQGALRSYQSKRHGRHRGQAQTAFINPGGGPPIG